MMSGSFVYFTTRIWWWPSIFLNFQYFWTKTFWDSYTSIRQIFSTWQWFPSIWCYYIWTCKNVQYLNEKPVKVEERSKFTIVNMFSMHINNFFFYFIFFSYSLRTVYFLDCLYLGLLGVGTSLFPPFREDSLTLRREKVNRGPSCSCNVGFDQLQDVFSEDLLNEFLFLMWFFGGL